MRRLLFEILVATALTIAAIITSAADASAGDVDVTNAFARASAAPAAKSGAAYVTIVNQGAESDRLVAVSTPAARSSELHRTVMDGDVMKMEPVHDLEIPANGTLAMSPGGMHIMLMGLGAPLKAGETIDLTLTFEKAGDVTVKVPIGGVAEGEGGQAAGSSGG